MAKEKEIDAKALDALEAKMKDYEKSMKTLADLIKNDAKAPVIQKQRVNCEVLLKAADQLSKKL
jgi:hypothetical protein